MKKILVLAMVSLLFISGCSTNNQRVQKEINQSNIKVENLEKEVKSLRVENTEMKTLIDITRKEKENFLAINHMAVEFVTSQTKGDIENLKKLLSDEIKIIKNGDSYYIADEVIYSKKELGIYQRMVIQSYKYIPKDDVYTINIKQVYEEGPEQIVNKIQCRYLDLFFKEINGVWKVVKLVFDV